MLRKDEPCKYTTYVILADNQCDEGHKNVHLGGSVCKTRCLYKRVRQLHTFPKTDAFDT